MNRTSHHFRFVKTRQPPLTLNETSQIGFESVLFDVDTNDLAISQACFAKLPDGLGACEGQTTHGGVG